MDDIVPGLINGLSSVLPYIPRIVLAVAVVLVGRWLAKKISRGLGAGLDKTVNANPALSRFVTSVVYFALLFIALMIALGIVGVDTSAVSGMVIGLGVALAFILKEPLTDFSAGVMLAMFRPFSVGDEVEVDGIKGVVTMIALTQTRMKTRNNIELIIRNSAVWGKVIRNHSALGNRRLDMVFGVSYDADIDAAIKAITNVAAADTRVHKTPKPWAKVVGLGDSCVDIELRLWCDYDNLRKLKVDISQPVKAALDAANIEIPYEHVVKIRKKVKRSKARGRIAKLSKIKNG